MTIGEKLREARLSKGISLDELQQITKIQKRYLIAIEEDNFDLLPGTFYVRAFIRQFASAVGLNGDRLVDQFDGKDDPEVTRPKRQVPEEVHGSRKALHEEEKATSSRVMNFLPIILLSVIACVIVGVVVYMTWQDRQEAPIISQSSSVSVDGPVDDSTSKQEASSEPKPAESTTESSNAEPMTIRFDNESGSNVNMTADHVQKPVKLSFETKDGRCWVGVIINGGYVWQQALEIGQKAEMELPEGTTDFTMVLGASGYVTVQMNGEVVESNPNQSSILKRDVHMTLNYAE